jgi:hypothetical protein
MRVTKAKSVAAKAAPTAVPAAPATTETGIFSQPVVNATDVPLGNDETGKTYVLLEDHGFINEYDARYFKQAGSTITNPIEIAILKDRKAPLRES